MNNMTHSTASSENNGVENLAFKFVPPLLPVGIPGYGEISKRINSPDTKSTVYRTNISFTETAPGDITQTHTNRNSSLPISPNQNGGSHHRLKKCSTVVFPQQGMENRVPPTGRRTSGNVAYNISNANVNQHKTGPHTRVYGNDNGSNVKFDVDIGAKRSYTELRDTSTRAKKVFERLVWSRSRNYALSESGKISIAIVHQLKTATIGAGGD